jgi:hypothetical protein
MLLTNNVTLGFVVVQYKIVLLKHFRIENLVMSVSKKEVKLQPQRLELSLNPEDGSLLTAPLSRVLIAATDGLYTELSNMVHSELQVTTAKPADEDDPDAPPSLTMKKEKMSNLSFAQRRHELSWRLARHSKALTHVAALTAAAQCTELAQATIVSTKALKHARTAWVQADEAQDALYFFHAQLFPVRQPPHDIFGALDILKDGEWKDLPNDLKLIVDRYETSKEYNWSANEVKHRWYMAVRDKLIRGEVADIRRQKEPCMWKVALSGGIVRLTHGEPKYLGKQIMYPLEAHLTVLSTSIPALWTLLSVEVRVQARTGESNHQLDTSNKQRFGLHRLCVKAMTEEEKRAEQSHRKSKPLDCLFQIAHNFSLSWRLEILSVQALALRRNVWSSKSSLVVTPVEFFSEGRVLGKLSISFWKVDDRYGPPQMSALSSDDGIIDLEEENIPKTSQLTLSIQAISGVGIVVSLSGGKSIRDRSKNQSHTQSTLEKFLDATSNPFALSASNALLAATNLCAEERCHAIVEALQPLTGKRYLPSWIHLSVESGSIAVSANVTYRSSGMTRDVASVVIFRLACDLRSGTFVGTFCRSAKLLRRLVSNEPSLVDHSTRRNNDGKSRSRHTPIVSSGRIVRDAFDSLTRSIDLLGTRTGVGGSWVNRDAMSESLRERAIQIACDDAKNCLTTCCGIAVVFGLCSVAIGVATGVTAEADLCGCPIEPMDGHNFLCVPPVGCVLNQRMIQNEFFTQDGERKIKNLIEREVFALTCCINDQGIEIFAFEISVRIDSPTSCK